MSTPIKPPETGAMIFTHDDAFYRAEAAAIGRELGDRKNGNGNGRSSKVDNINVPRTPPSSAPALHVTKASAIQIRPVKWLWHERIPLGTLALLGGREGIGKSICLYTLGADITRGRLPGVYAGTPRAIIVAATEDSWEFTIVPRLMAAGADLDRVFRVDVTTTTGAETSLSLPRDLAALEGVIRDVQAALIILDPLLSRLDVQLDTHKDSEVRLALEPLVALADKVGVSVCGIVHVNKSASNDALTTLMGSRAFAAVARAVLFVMTDPDDDTVRLLGQPKNNLGRLDVPTLKFTITGTPVAETPEGPVWTGKLVWAGETARTIREALEATAEASGDKSATSEAQAWLEDYLTEKDGTADAASIKRDGGKEGHSREALRRARQRLGVTIVTTGFPRRSVWSLPVSTTSGRLVPTVSTVPTVPTGPGETYQTYIHTLHLAAVDTVSTVSTVNASLPGVESTEPEPLPANLSRDEAWARADALFKKGWKS